MPNSTLVENKSANNHSGYITNKDNGRNCRRSAWRPTNLNIERFTLDEGSNMTQTHKYSVSTNSGSSATYPAQEDAESSRATTSSSKITLARANTSATPEENTERDKCTFSCGWFMTSVVGLACIAFILCIYVMPSEGIFPVSVNLRGDTSGHPLQRKGNLVVYPAEVSPEAISRAMSDSYIITLHPTKFQKLASTLDNITSEYNRSVCDGETPKPYVNCFLENPSPSNPCFFERGWLGRECTPEHNFGYQEVGGYVSPCFLIRILDAENWDPQNWSPKMKYGSSFIGLRCHPQRYEERHMVHFTQNPRKGFPQDFFPISDFKANEYIYPAVMLQMHGLKMGQKMVITCNLRARNAYKLRDSGSITITFQGEDDRNKNLSSVDENKPIPRREELTETTQGIRSSLIPHFVKDQANNTQPSPV